MRAQAGTAPQPAISDEEERERRMHSWFPWSRRRDMRHPALRQAHDDRTLGERVADSIASFGGSWPFIFAFLGFVFGWMVLNTVILERVINARQLDPWPYIALNLMLSGLAGLQAPVILMSQNRAAARDEALAGQHYEEGQRMERVLETMDRVLQQNTDLTKAIHDLTVRIDGTLAERGGGA